MGPPGRWRARMAVGMAGVAVAAGLALSGPAGAASADEDRLLGLSHALRASVGAPALAVDEPLAAVARAWAAKMASAGTISHNPNLGTDVTGWSKIAENVGMGPDVDTVHRALVASRSHYANLVDTEVSRIGIGVVRSGNTVFVVENFLRPAGGPQATTVKPAPATNVNPAPATTVKPAPVTKVNPAPATTVKPAQPPAPAPAPARPPVPAAPPADLLPSASPWLALALELTRGWAG